MKHLKSRLLIAFVKLLPAFLVYMCAARVIGYSLQACHVKDAKKLPALQALGRFGHDYGVTK